MKCLNLFAVKITVWLCNNVCSLFRFFSKKTFLHLLPDIYLSILRMFFCTKNHSLLTFIVLIVISICTSSLFMQLIKVYITVNLLKRIRQRKKSLAFQVDR
jgi:hypothetical protein